MMKKILYIVILCSLMGCKKRSQQERGICESPILKDPVITETSEKLTDLPEVNFKGKYPSKKIFIQEIADIEYIPLETKSNILLSGNAINTGTIVSDSLIVVFNRNDGTIFVFNRAGKSLFTFNHSGRGVGEYVKSGALAVDFLRQEIYILDFWLNERIYVYSLDGSYKRVLKLPDHFWVMTFFNYNENYLLCYEGYGVEYSSGKVGSYSKKPYVLISKEDGKVVPLDLTLKERTSANLYKSGIGFLSLPVNPIIKNGNEFLISDYACDTIYTLKEDKLSPFLVKRPFSLWKRNPVVLGYGCVKTNRYTLITFSELKWPENNSEIFSEQFIYDNKTRSIYKPIFLNSDYEGEKIINFDNFSSDLPENYVKYRLRPVTLIKDYRAGKLKGKLKEITARLNEDSNFVLMLIKFRD